MFNQQTYNIIVKVLENGAPALASELIAAINSLISENSELKAKLSQVEKDEQEQNKEE